METALHEPVFSIGIDLGGTKTEAIALAPDGTVLFRKRIATPRQDGYEAILRIVAELAREAVMGIPAGYLKAVGLGIPGSLDPDTGLVQNANTTCLINKPLGLDVERAVGCPVLIENDANCFTFAECRAGAGMGFGLVFGVIMGTGCGGGLCIDGTIRRGPHRIAGEWGHVSVDPQGAACYCGGRGCIETKISGGGVESAFHSSYGRSLSMQAILSGYRSGDHECGEAFKQFLDNFGRCLGGLVSVLDPDAIVLGGGLSNIEELYTVGVEKVRRYAFHRHIRTPVLQNRLGDSAGVFGAAWMAADAIRSS